MTLLPFRERFESQKRMNVTRGGIISHTRRKNFEVVRNLDVGILRPDEERRKLKRQDNYHLALPGTGFLEQETFLRPEVEDDTINGPIKDI